MSRTTQAFWPEDVSTGRAAMAIAELAIESKRVCGELLGNIPDLAIDRLPTVETPIVSGKIEGG